MVALLVDRRLNYLQRRECERVTVTDDSIIVHFPLTSLTLSKKHYTLLGTRESFDMRRNDDKDWLRSALGSVEVGNG